MSGQSALSGRDGLCGPAVSSLLASFRPKSPFSGHLLHSLFLGPLQDPVSNLCCLTLNLFSVECFFELLVSHPPLKLVLPGSKGVLVA